MEHHLTRIWLALVVALVAARWRDRRSEKV
jgi:hypothetical protein